MMPFTKLTCLSFPFFSFLFLKTCAQPSLQNDVSLILKVIDEKKESSVIILHSSTTYSEYISIGEENIIFKMSRILSKRKIASVTAAFSDWDEIKSYYFMEERGITHIKRPLFVIIIPTDTISQKFQQFTKELSQENNLFYLLLFTQTSEKRLIDPCIKPAGNPFHLLIDTTMVVKCYESNTLHAWYTFDNNETKNETWAIWHPETEYLEMVDDESKKKIDMGGKQLRIGIVKTSPLTVWNKKTGTLGGYFGDLLDALSHSMNFTWKLEKQEEDYGSWNKTGQFWTGAMGVLKDKKVDLLVSDMTMNSLRMTVADFSKILIFSRNLLFVRKPIYGHTVKWSGYFQFMDLRIWGAMILIVLIAPLILTLIKLKIQKFNILPVLISENYLNIWGIYCQQGLFGTKEEMKS